MKVKSVKQESILKQFYLYFLVSAIIPFIVFIYIILQASGKITAYVNSKVLLVIAGIFSALGFLGTRSFLAKIAALSNKLKGQTLDKLDKLDRSTILELAKGDEEVAHLAKAFSEVITNLEDNIRELKETKKTLYQVISNIGKTIGSIDNFEILIQFILETITQALGAKRGAIFFFDQEKELLKPKAIIGVNPEHVPTQLKVGEGAAGWVFQEKKPLLVPALDTKDTGTLFSAPLVSVPLLVKDKSWGVICLSGKKDDRSFSEEELIILSNLAYQIAVSVENFNLNAEAEKTYFETISALALAVEAKDPYSRGHSDRVAKYAVRLAEYMGLPLDDLNTLRDAARLHDIGKIGITDEILHKPGKLNSQEGAIMHRHPEIGEGIVRPLRNFRHIVEPIKHHHEFLDGSGYPDGLKGEQIPLIARVLTVADIFDAMITDRPYRKGLSLAEASKQIETMAEVGKIDRTVTNALFKLIEEKKLSEIYPAKIN